MDEQKIDIVITDDHKLFRRGIRSLLGDFTFVKDIYEAGNGLELLEVIEKAPSKPHVILLDVKMPEMDGIEANKKLRELYPDIKVIILTMEDDEQFILHMINEGVNGYLMKNADPDELELALKKVVTNDFYFSDDISAMVFRNFISGKRQKEVSDSELTSREIEVLELICKEFTASEIAEKMNLSVRTIDGFRRKLLEKTGTKNMAGLVVYAIKNVIVKI